MGFPVIPGSGAGGASVQDNLNGSSTTVAPSVRAVNEGLAAHANDTNPHAQYTTEAEASALDAAAIAAHEAAGNPHPIYLTQAEGDTLYAAQGSGGVGITDHGLLTGLSDDDHPQYINVARGDARYSVLGHTHAYETAGTVAAHEAAGNPHPIYLTQAEGSALYEPLGGGGGAVSAADITDSTSDGRALLTGNLAAQKTALSINHASQLQAETGLDTATVMDPLGTAQAITVKAWLRTELATQPVAETGEDNLTVMSPLRVAQSVAVRAPTLTQFAEAARDAIIGEDMSHAVHTAGLSTIESSLSTVNTTRDYLGRMLTTNDGSFSRSRLYAPDGRLAYFLGGPATDAGWVLLPEALADLIDHPISGFWSSAADATYSKARTNTVYIDFASGNDGNTGASFAPGGTGPKLTFPGTPAANTKYLLKAGTVWDIDTQAGTVWNALTAGVTISVYDGDSASSTYGQEITWQPVPSVRARNGGWLTETEKNTLYVKIRGNAYGTALAAARFGNGFNTNANDVLIRGLYFTGFANPVKVQNTSSQFRMEDCYFENNWVICDASNGYRLSPVYGPGDCIRIECDATVSIAPQLVRNFVNDSGNDAVWIGSAKNWLICDNAIRGVGRGQITDDFHSDGVQAAKNPNTFIFRRNVVEVVPPDRKLITGTNNGYPVGACLIISGNGTVTTEAGGLVQDNILTSNLLTYNNDPASQPTVAIERLHAFKRSLFTLASPGIPVVNTNSGRIASITDANIVHKNPIGAFSQDVAIGGTPSGIALTRVRQDVGAPAAATITPNAIVGNRIKFPTATGTLANLAASQVSHFAPTTGDISELRFTDVWWRIGDTFTIALLTAPYTIAKYVEYPSGTFTQVLWGGNTTGTLNTSTRVLTSDTVTITIPAGAQYWEHTINMGSSTPIPVCQLPAFASVLGVTDSQYTAGLGGVPAHQSSGNAGTSHMGSVLITGTIAAPNAKSVFVFGDSLPFGTDDITGVGAKQSSGYVCRKLDDLGVGHAVFTKGGMSASNMAVITSAGSPTFTPLLTRILECATHVWVMFGSNDLRLGRTQSQLLADYLTIFDSFSGKQIAVGTITPRSDSSNSYINNAGQTPRTDGNWGALTSVNAAIRALLPDATHVVEWADTAMTARDSGIWKSSPTVGFVPTTEGTHPTTSMHAYMAANTTVVLPS